MLAVLARLEGEEADASVVVDAGDVDAVARDAEKGEEAADDGIG
jgi:hypothetical protein